MELTEKQKMLGAALFARGVSKNNALTIIMALDTDDQIDDLTWFMGQNPEAPEEQLVAVSFQLAKEYHENKGE